MKNTSNRVIYKIVFFYLLYLRNNALLTKTRPQLNLI